MTRRDTWFERTRGAFERNGLSLLLGTPFVRSRLARSRGAPVDGRTLDAECAAMLGLDDIDGRSDLRALPPPAARAQVASGVRAIDLPSPPGVARVDRDVPGPAGPIPVRVYTPDGLASPSPGILFVHGGGFVTGDIVTHDGLCARLALGTRARVISVDYRLAPEHRFPAAADDATAAFRYCVTHASEFGVDPARVAVAGDSAGGNLSAVISRRAADDEYAPVFEILLYPGLDATCSLPSHRTFTERYMLTGPMIEWYYGHYFGEQDRRDPDGSPLLGVPTPRVPALVYTAGFDPLRDEGHAYAEKLRAAGGRVVYREFESLIHGFALMTGALSAARAALDEVCDDARRAFDGSFERRPRAVAETPVVEILSR